MARRCPVCPRESLQVIPSGEVEVELCPRCQGMWFDADELELFPDRPSTRVFLAAARTAGSRCRKSSHAVSRAMASCPTCKSEPVSCPGCGHRLSLVPTPRCVVDVCTACRGVWLDAGEFELLEGVTGTPAVPEGPPAAALGGWEIPKATDLPHRDAWTAPGQEAPLPATRGSVNTRRPFSCLHCTMALDYKTAWVLDGELYCVDCRPEGAQRGGEDPYWLSDAITTLVRGLFHGVRSGRRRGLFR